MTKIIPIANFIAAVIAIILSIVGIALAVMTSVSKLLAPFAIVTIVIGFTISAINSGVGFIFSKSKLCVAAGIMSLIALATDIASFIILVV